MRLLLAEDERELVSALTAILTHANYAVDAVYDGREALDYLKAGEYDGAILDIMMPKLDGLTVLREARAAGLTLPILMLTAKSEVDDRVAGLDAGADDYLAKPFAAKELLARIRAMTRRQIEMTDNVLRLGNLSLDCVSFEVTGPRGSIRLANKEFQILETLMRNPRRVVSAERLLAAVWGLDSDAEINLVWVFISYLRKKLAGVAANVRISVARNAGYTLEVVP